MQPMLRWKSYKYYKFLVFLEHAPYYIVIYGRPALQGCSMLSHKRHDFRKKVTEHKMFVLILTTTFSVTFLMLEELSEICSKIYIGIHVKYQSTLSYLMKI